MGRHFLFDAAVVSILGVVYRTQQCKLGTSETSRRHLQRAKSALDASIAVLRHCAIINRMARQYWTILVHFKQSFKGLLGDCG